MCLTYAICFLTHKTIVLVIDPTKACEYIQLILVVTILILATSNVALTLQNAKHSLGVRGKDCGAALCAAAEGFHAKCSKFSRFWCDLVVWGWIK